MIKVIAGPCAIEDEFEFVDFATQLAQVATEFPVELIIKGSFDKANRTRGDSPRGVGLAAGLRALREARTAAMCPVTTDVHETWQVQYVSQVVDIIQIPAFLSRQTDLLSAAAASGRIVNVKRGQFSLIKDVLGYMTKVPDCWVTYRGQESIGAARPICDVGEMMATAKIAGVGILDVTHTNNGHKELTRGLARIALPLGFQGIFAEVHPDPGRAISDGHQQLTLEEFRWTLEEMCGAGPLSGI